MIARTPGSIGGVPCLPSVDQGEAYRDLQRRPVCAGRSGRHGGTGQTRCERVLPEERSNRQRVDRRVRSRRSPPPSRLIVEQRDESVTSSGVHGAIERDAARQIIAEAAKDDQAASPGRRDRRGEPIVMRQPGWRWNHPRLGRERLVRRSQASRQQRRRRRAHIAGLRPDGRRLGGHSGRSTVSNGVVGNQQQTQHRGSPNDYAYHRDLPLKQFWFSPGNDLARRSRGLIDRSTTLPNYASNRGSGPPYLLMGSNAGFTRRRNEAGSNGERDFSGSLGMDHLLARA